MIEMVIEIGHFALILAFVVSIFQTIVPMVGIEYGRKPWVEVIKPAAVCQFWLLLGAFASLMYAYITSDFSVVNVVANSHSDKPLVYKISGVWGNHEGSMLLWVLILGFIWHVIRTTKTRCPSVFICTCSRGTRITLNRFYWFCVWTSNPFLRIFPPLLMETDLNPLLQDPALAFHPPFLYLGYVGFSLVFSFRSQPYLKDE